MDYVTDVFRHHLIVSLSCLEQSVSRGDPFQIVVLRQTEDLLPNSVKPELWTAKKELVSECIVWLMV